MTMTMQDDDEISDPDYIYWVGHLAKSANKTHKAIAVFIDLRKLFMVQNIYFTI